MKVVLVESQGVWLHFFDAEKLAAYLPLRLRTIPASMANLAEALAGVVRGGAKGSSISEQQIEFVHRAAGTICLTFAVSERGNARVEFREYSLPSAMGWQLPNESYSIVHETTMSSGELADMLYQILRSLCENRLLTIMDTDPLLFERIGEATKIYRTECKYLPRPSMRELALVL